MHSLFTFRYERTKSLAIMFYLFLRAQSGQLYPRVIFAVGRGERVMLLELRSASDVVSFNSMMGI